MEIVQIAVSANESFINYGENDENQLTNAKNNTIIIHSLNIASQGFE